MVQRIARSQRDLPGDAAIADNGNMPGDGNMPAPTDPTRFVDACVTICPWAERFGGTVGDAHRKLYLQMKQRTHFTLRWLEPRRGGASEELR